MKLTIKRMEEVNGPGTGVRNGWENIHKAHIVLSDLTGRDNTVYYWSGVAYGLGKKMVTLAKKGEVIPFDLRGVKRIEYQMNFAAGSKARKELKEALNELLNPRGKPAVNTTPQRPTTVHKSATKPSGSKAEQQQPVDIVILTVLKEEYRAVCRQLRGSRTIPGTQTDPNIYAWRIGTVFSKTYDCAYRVVVGMTDKAGNPQSTMAALEAVNLWEPRYIFFSGIAGGLLNFRKAVQDPNFKPDIRLGDVVIADVIHGYEYGKVGQLFDPRDDWNYQTDQGLLTKAIAYQTNPAWRRRIKLAPPRKCQPNVLDGQIASGDKVVDDPSNAFFAAVYRKWPKAKAVEMEGAGVGAAVNQARDRGKVVGFLMIRGISDIPRPPKSIEMFKNWEKERGTQERDNWKPYAAEVAAAYTVGLIAEGLPVPPKEKN
jgi:nucleoside phosphorylase